MASCRGSVSSFVMGGRVISSMVTNLLELLIANKREEAMEVAEIIGDFIQERHSSTESLVLVARLRSEDGPSILDLCDCMVKFGGSLCKRRAGKWLAVLFSCGHKKPKRRARKVLRAGLFAQPPYSFVKILYVDHILCRIKPEGMRVPRTVVPRAQRVFTRKKKY